MVGYNEGRKVSYWFSYDRNLLTLKYGKGYRMTETTIMEHSFLKDLTSDMQRAAERKRLYYLFSPEIRRVIEQYDAREKQKMLQTYEKKLLKGMTFGYDGKQMLVSSTGASPGAEQEHCQLKCISRLTMEFIYTMVPLMQRQPNLFHPCLKAQTYVKKAQR